MSLINVDLGIIKSGREGAKSIIQLADKSLAESDDLMNFKEAFAALLENYDLIGSEIVDELFHEILDEAQ